MEYTCIEGMTGFPFLMEERSSFMNVNCASTSSASDQLLESFQAQQQQLNPNFYYNPPQHFNFPAVSWSTTDPTLLLTEEDHQQQQQQQQQPEDLLNIGSNSHSLKVSCDNSAFKDGADEDMGLGLPSVPSAQQLFHKRSCTDLHHHVITPSPVSNRRDNTVMSRCSSASSIDPFAFCGGGGGAVVNAAQPQWMCSLPSDQYYGCADALMMPKLVSDPFSDSPPPPPHHQPPQQHHHRHQLEQPLATYYTSSTSVNCMHEADSCGSSDRDRSTTSEEINWISNSGNNNSDLARLPNLHGGCGGDSVTGLMLSSSAIGPIVELPDEYSSSIAAAAAAVDDVELVAAAAAVTTTTTPLDHVRRHHHRSACGSGTSPAIECSASAPPGARAAGGAPTGRVSWMAPGSSLVRKNNNGSSQITTPSPPTLDPLLQMQPLQIGNGRVPMLPRSVLGPFKQHRAFALDDIPTRLPNVQRPPLPLSHSSASQQQNCSSSGSGCSARYNSSLYSIMPPQINPGLVDNCTTSGIGLYKDGFRSYSSRPPQHLGGNASASVPSGGGVREFNVGGGFEASRKDYCSDHLGLLSSGSRKPNATSIEPQSVAARHRRKKISERVRILEKLIPGGNKMDTASMLDEAIEYVKFLQLQVQLLESMGEPEMFSNTNVNNNRLTAAMSTGKHNPPALYPHNSSKVDSGALIGGCGFGSSSSHLSRSSTLMQQVTIAAAAAAAATPTSPTSSPPLILSEVLQEQLFKQKLCLVSLRQYCPQRQVHRSC